MLEGLTGYFLLGWLLGSQPPRPSPAPPLIYLGGVLGWVWDVWANWASRLSSRGPLPSASGYRLSHYPVRRRTVRLAPGPAMSTAGPRRPLWARLSPGVRRLLGPSPDPDSGRPG